MAQDSKKKDVKKAEDPEVAKNLDFLRDLEMMEMILDLHLDQKMRPAEKSAVPEGKKK